MSTNTTTNNTVKTEATETKRGRKPLTFADIVASVPNETDHAWVAFLSRMFNITVDPKAVRLMFMVSVRELFHDSEEYKTAIAAKRERIDNAKKAITEQSVDSLLAKLSPEQRAELMAKLSA